MTITIQESATEEVILVSGENCICYDTIFDKRLVVSNCTENRSVLNCIVSLPSRSFTRACALIEANFIERPQSRLLALHRSFELIADPPRVVVSHAFIVKAVHYKCNGIFQTQSFHAFFHEK